LPGGIVKTPTELASDVYGSVDEMEDHLFSIIDFTRLLLAVTDGSEITAEHVPAVHRLLHSINGHAQSLRQHWDDAHSAAGRLAKP
jgi:hypothetical protein